MKYLLILLGSFAFLGILIVSLAPSKQPVETDDVKQQATRFISIHDQPSHLIDYGLKFTTPSSSKIESRILLVPHHLLPVRQLGEAFATSPDAKRIILLSPDHFSQCKKDICTTGATFTYKQQTIPTQRATTNLAEVNDHVFEKEHGIRGLLPFIRTRWAEASITPITIKANTPTSTVDELALWLKNELQSKDTFLVTTIDLSHYLPKYIADIHDRVTLRDLLSINPEHWKPMEIDNPPVARITLSVAKALGLKGTVLAHTNSQALVQSWNIREGTSHAIIRYAERGQDSEQIRTTLYTDPERRITSIEDRYYWGYDEIISTSTKQDWAELKTPTTTTRVSLPAIQENGYWLPVTDAEHSRYND